MTIGSDIWRCNSKEQIWYFVCVSYHGGSDGGCGIDSDGRRPFTTFILRSKIFFLM